MKVLSTSMLVVAVITHHCSMYGQDCAVLLHHGIYNVQKGSIDNDTASSFAQWFCDQQFSSRQDAESFGASLSFPFKGVPVKFGFDQSGQSWSEWSRSFCSQVTQSSSSKTSIKEYVQTIHQGVLDAFNRCMQTSGLHVWIERTGDPKVFNFAAQFRPSGAPVNKAVIEDFFPGNNVSCSPNIKGRSISASTFRARCKRTDSKAVNLVINADSDPIGGGALNLPEIPTFPPSPSGPSANPPVRSCRIPVTWSDEKAVTETAFECENMPPGPFKAKFEGFVEIVGHTPQESSVGVCLTAKNVPCDCPSGSGHRRQGAKDCWNEHLGDSTQWQYLKPETNGTTEGTTARVILILRWCQVGENLSVRCRARNNSFVTIESASMATSR
jgi:hypothetical protein